jgi:hypothetical protein
MSRTTGSTNANKVHPGSASAPPGCACGYAPSRYIPRGKEPLTLLPAIALMLLPKCPLCFAAWLGIFGSFGSSAWLSAVWGTPLAVALLSFAVAALALRARYIRNIRPLLLGLLGAAALLSDKYTIVPLSFVYMGLLLLTVACLWSSCLPSSRSILSTDTE